RGCSGTGRRKVMKEGSRCFGVVAMFLATLLLVGCGYDDNNNDYVIQVRVQPTPIQVSLAQPVTQASAGWAHTCAVLADGSANCWGGNFFGQLGNGGASVVCVQGTSLCSNGPVVVSGTTQWVSVTGGYLYTCGIDTTGAAHCWGAGRRGQLGDGNGTTSTTPTNVSGGLTFTQLAAATGGDFACGLSANALFCWGTGYFGQPGTGGVSQIALGPYRVGPAQSFTRVAIGELHACAIDNTGAAYCWGANGLGQ